MPPWPKERVVEALPFEYTGLDYFGPLYIKQYANGNLQEGMGVLVYLYGGKSYTLRTSRRYVC